ncbi:MAG TPA: Ku protein [Gemmatimonadaceae bacterium]|nr:Ku protein [Gemmatimonadaceae bacterium]
MATIWRGSVTFGLVNVPVELKPAVRDHRLSFRMLSKEGDSPIRFKRVREDTGDEVAFRDIVKGYEYEKGEYVILTDEDFEKAALKQSNTIDIEDFVEASEVDPRLYETAYFLVPGKGGDRAYALLRDAMAETGTVGIGKIILHKRQHIAELRADGKALVLMLLRFADEVVDPAEYSFPTTEGDKSRELKMATELVKSLQSEFDPSKYADEYDANLRRIINAKSKGRRVTLEERGKGTPEPKVLDLMEKLQQSLEATKKKPAAAKGSRRRKTA